jgi:hypothetical protein
MGSAAVLTGDVIASTSLHARSELPRILGEAFAALAEVPEMLVLPFEIYRGDSFQGVVRSEKALLAAAIVRARLRAFRGEGPDADVELDARIAIGIGKIEHALDRVVESDGEAFRRSGRALDEMASANDGRRMRIDAGIADDGSGADLAAQLLDGIASRWTQPAAEAVYLSLSDSEMTQAAMAERLSVSQPAISQRLKSARLGELKPILALYERSVAALAR